MKNRRFRYRITNDVFVPELSEDEGQTWNYFNEKNMFDALKRLGERLSLNNSEEGNKFLGNKGEVVFHKEANVAAFIAAAKVIMREIVIEDQNNEEP